LLLEIRVDAQHDQIGDQVGAVEDGRVVDEAEAELVVASQVAQRGFARKRLEHVGEAALGGRLQAGPHVLQPGCLYHN